MYFASITTVEIFSIAGSVVGGIVLLGLLTAGAGFLLQSFRGGRSQAVTEEQSRRNELDETYKNLAEAQDRRFQIVEKDHKDSIEKIGKLQGIIEEQTKQQKWFEGIFISALDKFFKDNPGLAYEIDGKIKRGRQK